MVDVENTPPFDVLMKLNSSGEKKELERNNYEEKCLNDEELRIALEVDDVDEMLDVESQDVDELDGSDTSSSAVGGSPQRAPTVNIVPIMLASDIPQTSCSEVMIFGSALEMPNSGSHIEKRHICDICGKGFPYHSILESHKRCHTGEKPFNCHFCEKKFAQKATLQVHERTHTGERPYKCRYCEKTFAQYGTKTVHEKSAHLGIRNYKCPKCDKCLSSPSALYTHKKTHGEKTFQKSQLIAHEATHASSMAIASPKEGVQVADDVAPEKKTNAVAVTGDYQCKFCGKRYAYASSLCQFCDKSFTNQGNMQVHKRVHTGERPYTCTTCGKSYAQKVGLNIHLEQCEAHMAKRQSEICVKVDTDLDCSDSDRKADFSLPNIYAKNSPPVSINQVNSLSRFPQWNMPDILRREPVSSYEFQPTTTTTTVDTSPVAAPFCALEHAPPDYGPLTASKPLIHHDVTMSETSAFYTPACTKSVEPVLSGMTALKGLVENGLSPQLLPLPNILSQQLLNTQLLIQQLQNNDALLSLLNHSVSAMQPPVPSTAPLVQTTTLPHSFFETLFPTCLMQSSLPVSSQPTLLPYNMEVKSESMLV
ncbi:hypothetical protein Angca_008926 [Angiostrongylus cantonensis]|nr:hypothetical protein Angca_008926 [Angiostrongylus cantonensis]